MDMHSPPSPSRAMTKSSDSFAFLRFDRMIGTPPYEYRRMLKYGMKKRSSFVYIIVTWTIR